MSNAALSTLSWQEHPSNATAFASNTLQDVWRALQILAPIRTHALHVYQSALVTIPKSLLLDTVTQAKQPNWLPRLLPPRMARWGASMQVLEDNSNGVTCFAYSADGTRIVSSSRDCIIRVWNAVTFEQIVELEGPHSAVNSVSFSSDSKWVVSSSDDQSVRVWHAVTFQQLGVLERQADNFSCVAFSSDGKRVVSGSHNGSIWIWDTQTPAFEQLGELEGHKDKVTSVACSPSYHTLIVSGSQDLTVRIWDTATCRQLAKLALEDCCAPIVFLAFSPNSNAIFSRDEKSNQRAWMCRSFDGSM
jgi:WD40 repeat protein